MLIHALIREKTVTRNMDSTPTFYQRDQRLLCCAHHNDSDYWKFSKFQKKTFLTILLSEKNNAYRLILNQTLIQNLLIRHEIENHKL